MIYLIYLFILISNFQFWICELYFDIKKSNTKLIYLCLFFQEKLTLCWFCLYLVKFQIFFEILYEISKYYAMLHYFHYKSFYIKIKKNVDIWGARKNPEAEYLKRAGYKNCANCRRTSPTCTLMITIKVASLDFGIFICPNCSGTHRHLGHTITPDKIDKAGWMAKRLGRKHEDRKLRNQPILGSGWKVSDNWIENKGFRKQKPGAPLEEHHRYEN